ncbi:MAG: hypothetical protein KDI63_14915 [Gammaproteobacteria bacterium]|nr:hypothetical protein [Gammaproteobacteria bacterium]
MIRLLRTNPSRYQSLDTTQLKARFVRLQSLLSNASPATKSVFAEPAPVQGSDNIDWLAHLGGQPQPLSKMPQADAAAARSKLNAALNDVLRIANERAGASPDDAAFLRSIAAYPSDDDIFVLNGQPVIAAWGHGLAGKQPMGPSPAAAAASDVAGAAVLASGAAHAAGDGTEAAQASGRGWGRRFLLLFLLLLALALLAWWYYRDFNWPPWFDYAAFHEAAGLSEQELIALADVLEEDIEALRQKCTPQPGVAVLKGEESSLRDRVASLQSKVAAQGSLYDQHQIPYSQELRALQSRVPPFNERISAMLRECDAIVEDLERKRAEDLRRKQEEERLRHEEALERERQEKLAREAEEKRKAEQAKKQERKQDEFDKRRTAAGGEEGELTVTLLWNTIDDLDLHVTCPDTAHIYYLSRSGCGGMLDVDQNARYGYNGLPMGRVTREPVENVFWPSARNGKYRIKVDLYKEGTRTRAARPFKIKVQKGEDVQYFEGEVSSGNRDAYFDFSYP